MHLLDEKMIHMTQSKLENWGYSEHWIYALGTFVQCFSPQFSGKVLDVSENCWIFCFSYTRQMIQVTQMHILTRIKRFSFKESEIDISKI